MTNEADFENMARQQKTIEALRAENESMQGSLDSLRNFLGDIKLPVGRAIQLIKDQRAELDRLREADVLLRDAEYELVWTGGARDFNSSDGDAHEGWVKGPKAVVDRIRRYFRKVISFICDRCGCEWVVQTTDGKDDVFYKVQEDMGRLVCPECLGWAKELDADETN